MYADAYGDGVGDGSCILYEELPGGNQTHSLTVMAQINHHNQVNYYYYYYYYCYYYYYYSKYFNYSLLI